MRRRTLAGLLGLALLACGGDDPTPGPVPGVLEVVVLGPVTNTGAVLFDLAGGTVDSVVSAGSYTISAPYTAATRRVAVAGDSLHGTIALVYVPDISAGPTATVVEAASGADFHLLAPADFRLLLIASVE